MLILEEYIDTMTVVIGALTKDAIVMVADGRARSAQTDRIISDQARKIFSIKNGIHWSLAAADIYPGELDQLAAYMRLLFRPFEPPYEMIEVVHIFALALRDIYKNNLRKQFGLDIMVGGYGKDIHNKPTEPALYAIRSKENYEKATKSPRIAYGDMVEGDFSLEDIPGTTKKAAKYMQQAIMNTSKRAPSVGGDIMTVIIRGDNVEETIQTTN